MKLNLEIQGDSRGAPIKYQVIGSVLQDQSFDGNVLYKIVEGDSESEEKFWVGKDLRSC